MPIFDQGYQHWQGELSGHAWRWLTIARQGVRTGMKNRWVRLVTLIGLIPALVLAGFLILWGLAEQQVNRGILQSIGFLPDAIRNSKSPEQFRVPIWTMAYQYYFETQMIFCMLLVLLVGPSLISQDLRFNAIPLYFSRPLRRFDYFLGKLGVIAVFLGGVAIVPALIAYALGVGFSLDLSVVKDTSRVLGAGVLYGLVVVLSAGTLMLAISSLSRNSRYVGATWVGLWIISGVVAGILTETLRSDWCPAISYVGNLRRVGELLLDTASARSRLPSLSGSRPPPPPTPPWYLTTGILASLFGLSLWTLTFRVKSLDRLK
jgi:ABC-2 type transport system permease protein